jgi:hypothetical protein
VPNRFFCEYGPEDCTKAIVQEVELLFAKALVNPMAARRARRAAKKGRGKRGENSGEPEAPLPYSAGPGPPHTATSQIGNADAGESLLRNAPAAAEQASLSALDGNALPPKPSPRQGTKRKARGRDHGDRRRLQDRKHRRPLFLWVRRSRSSPKSQAVLLDGSKSGNAMFRRWSLG